MSHIELQGFLGQSRARDDEVRGPHGDLAETPCQVALPSDTSSFRMDLKGVAWVAWLSRRRLVLAYASGEGGASWGDGRRAESDRESRRVTDCPVVGTDHGVGALNTTWFPFNAVTTVHPSSRYLESSPAPTTFCRAFDAGAVVGFG